jgi:peroxiredoxin
MHRHTALRVLAACLMLWLAMGSLSSAAPPPNKLANLKFSGTISEADQKYLGLEKPGAFTLQDIKAPYVLLEIMRTTCPHCVAQAPALNQLYKLVANSDLKDKLKIISVGETDNASTLKHFKAAHQVPFALVADPDTEIGSAFAISGTPTTVLVDKRGKVLLMEVGAFESAGQMFKIIKTKLK